MNIVVLFIAFLFVRASEHCLNYKGATGICQQCEPGYALAQDKSKCLACPLHCKDDCYINEDGRALCFNVGDSPCNPAIPNCGMCDDTQKNCKTCNDGYWLDDGDCDKCNTDYCKICAQTGDPCTQCFPGFIQAGNTCTCPIGHFKANGNTQCLGCDVTCDTCIENSLTPGISKCTKCKDPNANYNQHLPACQCNPKFRMDTTNNVCVSCPSLCPTCHSDAGNLPVCDSCADPVLMDPLKNCDCKDGYYMLSTTTCAQCTQFCSICKNSGANDVSICTSCTDKANMIPDPDNPANCICSGNRWYNTNACTNCDASCNTCDHYVGNCKTCAYAHAHSIGMTCVCDDKFFNDNSKCANCPASCAKCSSLTLCTDCTDNPNMNIVGGVCECKKGTFIISTNLCIPCGTGCVDCSPIANDKSQCKTCIDPSMDIIGDICQCKPGNFLLVDKCTPCDTSCSSCHNDNGLGVCDTCYDTNAIPQGNICVCKPYFYPDTNKKCTQCPAFCPTCHLDTATVKCDSCQYNNMIVDPTNFLCRCNNAFYQLKDNSCKACGTNCISCTNDGSDNSVCQKCSDNNMNIIPADGSCVCKPAFFPTGQTKSVCTPCQQDCSICHNTGDDTPTCDTCMDPYALPMPKDCACIAMYFKYNYKCYNCPISCNTCVGRDDAPDQPKCLSCSDNNHMTIINFICLCNGPSYLNTDSRLCLACGQYCNACENKNDGSQNSNCLECADPNALPIPPANTDCYCKNGYYPVGPACYQCDTDCAICEYKNNNKFCNKCLDPNALPNDSGKCVCIPGRYLNVNSCDLCPDTCISCASANNLPQCDLCVDAKMIIVNGVCQCPNGFYVQADGTCGSCPERCSSCNLAGSIVVCDSCIDVNMVTSGSDCVCKSKYYMENNVCYQCPSPCDVCASSLTPQTPVCTVCHDTTNTVIINGNCECKPGMFMLSSNMCQTCGFKCSICKNQKDLPYCEACEDGSNFIPVQGYCVCKGGYFMKTDFICYTCPATQLCSTCFNKGNDQAICSSCIDNEGMTINKDGNCVCKNHYYLVADKSRCALCAYPCYLCSLDPSSKLVCNQCSDTQNMDPLNNCQCKSHQYMSYDKKSCMECPISCSTCAGDSTDTPTCKSCLDINMILSQNCQSCTPGYYMTTDVKKCLACPETCSLCKGLSDNSPYCTLCKDKENMFIDIKFTCTCNSRLYFSKVEQKCHECETRCFNCTDFGHDHCKNCNTAITFMAPINNGVCDCDNLHKWSEAEKICRIKKEPSNLLIIILAVVVGLMVAGLIFYVICIK